MSHLVPMARLSTLALQLALVGTSAGHIDSSSSTTSTEGDAHASLEAFDDDCVRVRTECAGYMVAVE